MEEREEEEEEESEEEDEDVVKAEKERRATVRIGNTGGGLAGGMGLAVVIDGNLNTLATEKEKEKFKKYSFSRRFLQVGQCVTLRSHPAFLAGRAVVIGQKPVGSCGYRV